ncbi:two-component system histidine kinase PnpS [Streptococcus uberis]|uniref:two-component system histidine kinase PnpS n=1 Tax=Streptococcus uberis TaxID=1349 RepID=UPI0012B5C1C7|nr:ATP-binding protein [Streptococcus uberis]MTB48304.1 two-component sensor histidine kinase [Streptococcus uberis]
MKQNLRKIEILLFLSLLSFVLAILETKWELFFHLISALLLASTLFPLRQLMLWEKQFQLLEKEEYASPETFMPDSQKDLRQIFSKHGALKKELAKRKEESQKLSSNLEALTSHLTMGMFLVSETKDIQLYSKSLPHYFPDADKPFQKIEDIGRTDVKAVVAQAFITKKTIKKELKGYNDGDLILEVTAVPIFNQYGTVFQVLVLLYDLTTIRDYEKLNMDFISNASHELRTPVTSIKGFAETIKNMPEEEQTLKDEFLDIIYNESLRLEHIVEHMLTLSKVNKTQLQKTEIALNDFLYYIGNSMKHQLHEKHLQLSFDLAEDVTIKSDKYLLSQILLNLMSNAIRYTDEGGKITISTAFKEGKIQITVSDTGIGISKLEQDRIFERFYRVNKGRSRQSGGTGLGLSIVKELSQVLGGQVFVKSQIGKGSHFTLEFPKSITS